MKGRKGQSAIEYLVTYSWMLLAVSVAAATTFSAVDRSCERSSFGFYSDTIEFQSFATNENDTLVMNLENNAFEKIDVGNVSVQREDGLFRSVQSTASLPVGDDGVVAVPGYAPYNGCSTLDMEITYDRGPLSSQTISGQLRAPYDVVEVPTPGMPGDLSITL